MESQPLISAPSHLSAYLAKRLGQDMDPADSKAHNISKGLLQFIGLISAAIFSGPSIRTPINIGPKNPIYRGFLTYGEHAAFPLINAWALFETFDLLFEPMGEAEWATIKMKKKVPGKIILAVTAVGLGILLRSSAAYLEYLANGHKISSVIPLLAVDSWLPIYSSALFIGTTVKAIKHLWKSKAQKEVIQAKKRVIHAIDRNLSALPLASKEERKSLVDKISEIKNKEHKTTTEVKSYAKLITEDHFPNIERKNCGRKVFNVFFNIIGGGIALGMIYGLGTVGYSGADTWKNNPKLSWAAGILTGLLYAPVLFKAIPSSSDSLLMGYGYFKPNFIRTAAPKATAFTKFLGLLIFPLSYGAAVNAGYYFFPKNPVLKIAMPVVLGASCLALAHKCYSKVVSVILSKAVMKKIGSKEEKELMLFFTKMHTFKKVLNNAPLSRVAEFIRDLPEESKNQILNGLNTQLIQNYVKKKDKQLTQYAV